MKSKNCREKTPFLLPEELNVNDVPAGVDRPAFPMRSAIISSAAVISGCSVYNKAQQCACSRCCGAEVTTNHSASARTGSETLRAAKDWSPAC